MKRFICFLFMVIIMISVALAEKPMSWVDLTNIRSNNNLNVKVGDEWYPIQFYFDGMAVSNDGGTKKVRSALNLGIPQNTTFDLGTLEGQKEWYQALPPILKPVAKDLRLQATNEDITE